MCARARAREREGGGGGREGTTSGPFWNAFNISHTENVSAAGSSLQNMLGDAHRERLAAVHASSAGTAAALSKTASRSFRQVCCTVFGCALQRTLSLSGSLLFPTHCQRPWLTSHSLPVAFFRYIPFHVWNYPFYVKTEQSAPSGPVRQCTDRLSHSISTFLQSL